MSFDFKFGDRVHVSPNTEEGHEDETGVVVGVDREDTEIPYLVAFEPDSMDFDTKAETRWYREDELTAAGETVLFPNSRPDYLDPEYILPEHILHEMTLSQRSDYIFALDSAVKRGLRRHAV